MRGRTKLCVWSSIAATVALIAATLVWGDPLGFGAGGLSAALLFAVLAAMLLGVFRVTRSLKRVTKIVPRTLPRDTLNDPGLLLTLPERIESAIEQSKAESRSFGVACLRVGDFAALARNGGPEAAEHLCTSAIGSLVSEMRRTDRALYSDDGEILLLLPLLEERRNLEDVAARLGKRMAQCLRANGEPVPTAIDIGVAMYPIDGYRANELIASAQANAKVARAARLGRPTAVRRPDAGPLPVKPARKAAPRQRRPRRMAAGLAQ